MKLQQLHSHTLLKMNTSLDVKGWWWLLLHSRLLINVVLQPRISMQSSVLVQALLCKCHLYVWGLPSPLSLARCLLPDDGVVVLLCILTSLSSLSHSSGISVFPQAGLQSLFGLHNINLGNITIEPVDSIYRDSMDMQRKNYDNTKKPSWECTINLGVFSWPTRFLVSQESIAKLLKEKVTKCPKLVYFTFWDWLVHYSFTTDFTWNGSILHGVVHNPLLLHCNFKVSQGTNTILHSTSNCPLGVVLYSSYRTWTVTTYPYCHIQPSLMVRVLIPPHSIVRK